MNAILNRTQVKPHHFAPLATLPNVQRTNQLTVARERLSSFVKRMAHECTRRSGINYEESDAKSCESWEATKAMFQQAQTLNQPVYVRKSDSENSIYTSEAANWAFRFWHDYLHYKHDLTFSFIDEVLVGQFQVSATEREFGEESLEAKLMAADTIGQVLYYQMHGEFVANQLSFVTSAIQKH